MVPQLIKNKIKTLGDKIMRGGNARKAKEISRIDVRVSFELKSEWSRR